MCGDEEGLTRRLRKWHGPVKFKKAVTPDELRHANYELKGAKGDKEARKIAMRLGGVQHKKVTAWGKCIKFEKLLDSSQPHV